MKKSRFALGRVPLVLIALTAMLAGLLPPPAVAAPLVPDTSILNGPWWNYTDPFANPDMVNNFYYLRNGGGAAEGIAFWFTSTTGTSYQCSLDGAPPAPCGAIDASYPNVGVWRVAYSLPANGVHTFTVAGTNASGTDLSPASQTFTVDTAAPGAPSITSGPAVLSNSNSATFNVVKPAGADHLECALDLPSGVSYWAPGYDPSNTPLFMRFTLDPWSRCASPKTYSGLSDGTHKFSVVAVDQAGNPDTEGCVEPLASGAPSWIPVCGPSRVESYTWVVDTTPPDTSIDGSVVGPLSPNAQFFFSSPNSASEIVTFECRFDGGAWTPCTSPANYAGLTAGDHVFEVRAKDQAGNVDPTPPQVAWTIGPDTTITSGPSNPSDSTSASFSFTATLAGSTFECRLDGGAWTPCTSPSNYAGLTGGTHTFDVRASNSGFTDPTPASWTWSIQVDTTITSGPSTPTNSTSATFVFTATVAGSTFECRLDGAPWTACTSPESYSSLSAGTHTFEVRASIPGYTDPTPASWTWSIQNATVPDTSILSGPWYSYDDPYANPDYVNDYWKKFNAHPATDKDPLYGEYWPTQMEFGDPNYASNGIRFWFTATSATTYECRLSPVGGPPGGFAPCALGDGLSSGGPAVIPGTNGQPDQQWGAVPTMYQAYPLPADGQYVFEVRGVGPGGTDATPAQQTFTVDTTPPASPDITSGPASLSGSGTATFHFTKPAGAFYMLCAIDDPDDLWDRDHRLNPVSIPPWTPCTSGTFTRSGLTSGLHRFSVVAVDQASNPDAPLAVIPPAVGTYVYPPMNERPCFNIGYDSNEGICPAGDVLSSWTWAVDVDAPDTAIDAIVKTGTTSADVYFSSPGSASEIVTFQCRLDGTLGTWFSCVSPNNWSGLGVGDHLIEVRAIDQVGNVDPTPASANLHIGPETEILSGPTDPTTSTTATFTFISDLPGSTFECSLDAGAWVACTSPAVYTLNPAGPHSLAVRATESGLTDTTPATWTWTVTEPNTTILSGPNNPSNSPDATFTFESDSAEATFECNLDSAGWVPCVSPQSYLGLLDGPHLFSVRATNLAGDVEADPPSVSWTVDAADPDTTILSGPSDPANLTLATFTFVSSETGSTFECQLDGGAWTACTSPWVYHTLSVGLHTFAVRAVDQFLHTDPTPATWSWTAMLIPTLTVRVNGSGTVVSDTGGINCDPTCTADFTAGAVVKLTATPDYGWTFSGWTGACSGSSSTCTLTMTADKSATAQFSKALGHQPDAMLKSGTSGWVGQGVWNDDGTNQTLKVRTRPGGRVGYNLRFANAGYLDDAFTIKGCASQQGFSVRYVSNGRNVTAAVTSGAAMTRKLSAGEYAEVHLTVTALPSARGLFTCNVITRSLAAGGVIDVIRPRVEIR